MHLIGTANLLPSETREVGIILNVFPMPEEFAFWTQSIPHTDRSLFVEMLFAFQFAVRQLSNLGQSPESAALVDRLLNLKYVELLECTWLSDQQGAVPNVTSPMMQGNKKITVDLYLEGKWSKMPIKYQGFGLIHWRAWQYIPDCVIALLLSIASRHGADRAAVRRVLLLAREIARRWNASEVTLSNHTEISFVSTISAWLVPVDGRYVEDRPGFDRTDTGVTENDTPDSKPYVLFTWKSANATELATPANQPNEDPVHSEHEKLFLEMVDTVYRNALELHRRLKYSREDRANLTSLTDAIVCYAIAVLHRDSQRVTHCRKVAGLLAAWNRHDSTIPPIDIRAGVCDSNEPFGTDSLPNILIEVCKTLQKMRCECLHVLSPADHWLLIRKLFVVIRHAEAYWYQEVHDLLGAIRELEFGLKEIEKYLVMWLDHGHFEVRAGVITVVER